MAGLSAEPCGTLLSMRPVRSFVFLTTVTSMGISKYSINAAVVWSNRFLIFATSLSLGTRL